MDNEIKVSIVVPVYNIEEKILRACIESCINQTMREIEIILVDDGSTNNSADICDEYASKDNRIVVIHKKNGGLSAARNTGYRVAKGSWITFLDSDDWIEADTCQDNFDIGTKENADIVIFGTIQEFEKYRNPFKYHYENGRVFSGDECKDLQCEILNFHGNIATAWAKLINKGYLDKYKIEHNEKLRQGSEGVEFNIRLFENINKACFNDKIYYHYVFNPNSISAKHDENNHIFVINCFEEIRKQIEASANKDRLIKLLYNRFAYVIIATAISGYFSPANKQRYKEKCKAYNKYLSNSFVRETLAKMDYDNVDFQRRIIIRLIKGHIYPLIALLAKLRYIEKH